MTRAILLACLPWMAVFVGSVAVAWLLARLSQARLDLRRFVSLHRDQQGSAQSLSFVLTLPLFIWVMMLIVQVSQLMVATIVVHYAAYASARSAAVWIPASLPEPEEANCVSFYHPDPEARDQVFPVLDSTDPNYRPIEGGVTYRVEPSSRKYDKIASAAVLACASVSPSRDVGYRLPPGSPVGLVLKSAYAATVPAARDNAGVGRRLDHKLAYAVNNTEVQIRFYHKNEEPPLVTYYQMHDPEEFHFNELGWQDMITVTVKYKLALLPGPGRLLARMVSSPTGQSDEVSRSIQRQGDVYVYPLEASAVMGNEGEKSLVPYVYPAY